MPPIIPPTKELVNTLTLPLVKAQKETVTSDSKEIRVVFFGTPNFAVPILKELLEHDFKPMAVITAPDKPVGRKQEIVPPPIKILARENNIPVFQPETKEELLAQTINLKPDLIILAAYGKILPKEILDMPKYGAINVHPSLLPKYRGASPIQFAILNGEEETGTTIMLMNEKVDEGPILSQEKIKIAVDETYESLEKKLSDISAKLLIKTLDRWIILKEMSNLTKDALKPQEQDNSEASYTKILNKKDGQINWQKPAIEIERQIRAFYPWPGSFTSFTPKSLKKKKSKRRGASAPEQSKDTSLESRPVILKIIKASVLNPPPNPSPFTKRGRAREGVRSKDIGRVFLTENKKLAVQTGEGCLIISELQPEGGKAMFTAEFLNGHSEIINAILE